MRWFRCARTAGMGAGFFALLLLLGVDLALEKRTAAKPSAVASPMFEVDPMWPKPLPNHWVMGWTVGLAVDAQDHIWVVHQANKLEAAERLGAANPPGGCCIPAPPVIEFDQAGNLIGNWGGPGAGYDWPDSNHGITTDYKGNVWIGGNGRGAQTAGGRGGGGPGAGELPTTKRARLAAFSLSTTIWS